MSVPVSTGLISWAVGILIHRFVLSAMRFGPITETIEKFDNFVGDMGYRVEPGMMEVYFQILCVLGIYKLWTGVDSRGRIRSLVLRVCYHVVYWFAWLLTPAINVFYFLGKCCVIRRIWLEQRRADCVQGGPPSKIGYFRWNGKDFVRHHDLTTSRVRLLGGTTTIDNEGRETTSSKWEIIEPTVPADLSPGESALSGLASNARPATLEKGQVLVYDPALNLFSSAIVVDNVLVMSRHKTLNLNHIIVKGTNLNTGAGPQNRKIGVRIELSRAYYLDNHGAPKWDEKKHTCTFLDFMAIPLEKDEISMIGVKTFKEKDVTRNYEMQRGTITYSVDDFGSVIKEEGTIAESNMSIHNLGLAMAYIVSQPGASSSAVCVVQNGLKLAGMWLGLPAHSLKEHRGSKNLFMHSDAIMANLDRLGLVKSPLLTRIRQWGDSLNAAEIPTPTDDNPGESRESKKERALRQWQEYLESYDLDQLEYDSEAEDWDNELVHGYRPGQSRSGHAREVVSQPLIVLPADTATPAPPPTEISDYGTRVAIETARKLQSLFPGESAAEVAMAIAEKHNRLDLNAKVKDWKYGILNDNAAGVLKEITYFTEEASSDVRERLAAVLAVPSNALLRDYMQKVSPEWTLDQEGEVIPDMNGDPYFRRVGTYQDVPRGKTKKPKEGESDLQKRLRALALRYYDGKLHGCTKGEYKIPVSSKKNIDRSLKAQARLATATAPKLSSEQQEEFDAAVRLVREKYSAGIGDTNIKTYLEEGELGFLKTFISYEDKSSGVSARYRNMKKSAWVKTHPEEVVDLTLSRLILIAVAGDQLKELDAVELVKYGCSDVKEIFMKGEGHSPQKIEEGRFRLIWISSLVDLTVQAMLHKADNSAHVDAYQAGNLTCAALGMGHSPDGLKQLVSAFEREGVADSNISSDASAFDLSIDGALFIHNDGERRGDNCANKDVGRLVKRYAHILCSHVLNNQGDVWLVLKYGVTTSGQLSTTTQNTFARSVMAAYGGCKGWTCAGDDLVGDDNFDQRRLLDFGVRSRDVERHEGEADFTSHLINTRTSTAVFGNVEKLLWHLYDTCVDLSANRERFGGILYILRDTPGVREDIVSLASEFGIDTNGYVAESSLIRDLA